MKKVLTFIFLLCSLSAFSQTNLFSTGECITAAPPAFNPGARGCRTVLDTSTMHYWIWKIGTTWTKQEKAPDVVVGCSPPLYTPTKHQSDWAVNGCDSLYYYRAAAWRHINPASTPVTYTAGTGIDITGTVISNTAPDQTVALTGAGINVVTGTYPNFTVTGTEVDGSVSNELQTLASTSDATSHTVTLSNSGGSVQLVEGTGIGIATTGTGLNGIATVTNTAPDQTVVLNNGTGINTTGTYPNFTINNTGVTSVGLDLPAEFVEAGTPVTGAGTLSAIWAAQAANLVFRSGNAGGTPSFTALTAADIPAGIASLWTDGGATTYLTATTDNVAIGTTTASSKLTVSGDAKLLQNGTDATSTVTQRPSYKMLFEGSSWTGAAQAKTIFSIYQTPSASDNTPRLLGDLDGVGYLRIDKSSDLTTVSNVGITAIGYEAGIVNTTGYNSAYFGGHAGKANTTGYQNTFLGSRSGVKNTTGYANTFIGQGAGYENITSNYSVFVGWHAGLNVIGAGSSDESTYVGSQSGQGAAGSTGISNAFLGARIGQNMTSATENAIVGRQAANALTSGSQNSILGAAAGISLSTGSDNVFIGRRSGYTVTAGNATTTGNQNIFIGTESGSSTASQLTNAIAIGYRALVGASNTMVLGNSSITNTLMNGNVGIGTTAPNSKLDVTTDALGVSQTNTSGIVLSNNTAAAAGAQQISPGLRWRGNGWKTDATAASQTVDFLADVLPVQGTANPTGTWRLGSSVNGGAYSNVLTVTSGGRVGIGTDAPSTLLDVSGVGVHGISLNQDIGLTTNSERLFFRASGGTYAVMNEGNILTFRSGATIGSGSGTTRMAINSSGLLGIGTTSPDRLFHAEASDAVTNAVTYTDRLTHITSGTATTGFGAGAEVELENGSGTNRVAATQEVTWSDAVDATEDADYKLKLMRAGTLTNALTVLSTGNVGVGVGVPTTALEIIDKSLGTGVKGQLHFEGSVTNPNQKFSINRYSTSSYSSFELQTAGARSWGIGIRGTEAPSGGLSFYDFSAALIRMSIDLSGNVGIGNTAPGEKLEVTGNGKFTGTLASTRTTSTLAAAATTLAITRNVVTVTGDAGGNTLATITGAQSGQILTLIFVDGLVTITDDGTATANTVNLSAAFTSTAGDVLTLVNDGTSWYEVQRSIN